MKPRVFDMQTMRFRTLQQEVPERLPAPLVIHGKDGADGRDGKDGISIKGERGEKGEAGKDGREIEMRVHDDYFQWRYTGDEDWQNLAPIPKARRSVGGGAGAVASHEQRTDPHPQYLNTTRADERYYSKAEIDAFFAQLVGGTPL
jgi:hypothetical protein